jgi:integrase
MASISNDKNGKRRILFVDGAGKRRTIWLGRMPKKAASALGVRVDELVQNQIAGASHSAELLGWLRGLPEITRGKLVRVGLLEAAPEVPTVEMLIDRFIDSQHVKDATMDAYRQTTGSLKAHLGAKTLITKVTTAHADAWRKSLATDGYATATIAKRVIVAKGIFSRAVRWKLLTESPFEHLKAGSQANQERAMHVDRKVVLDLLPHCPSTSWRAILGLCRFAGLRCPSELTELRWSDVNWDTIVMTVRSPKTAHHDGKGIRVVPVDPALQPILWKLWEEAPVGSDRMFPDLASASNLRTQFCRILARAGVAPWPRLFQNLRASCETDWVEEFPAHQVASWLGHSPAVAREHYLQPRDHHVRKASGGGVPWIQSAPSENRIADCIADGSETASQNASQQGAAPSRTSTQPESQTNVACGFTRSDATRSETLQATGVGGEGFEPP